MVWQLTEGGVLTRTFAPHVTQHLRVSLFPVKWICRVTFLVLTKLNNGGFKRLLQRLELIRLKNKRDQTRKWQS